MNFQTSSKPTNRPLILARRITVATLSVLAFVHESEAASQTWKPVPTDANWLTATNWVAGAVPGSTTAVTNDVATFNSALSGGIGGLGNPIVIDTGRIIGGITFDTANVGPFVIGANAGNALRLSNIGAGPGTHVIQMSATVATSQVIAAPITFIAPSSTNGIFGFVNNASTSAATLTLSGTMTNAVARPAIVMLDGTNTGTNAITGNISFTAATQSTPYLIKRGAGTWTLSGANVFSGTPMTSTDANYGIQVLDGVLSLQNNNALGTSATANQLQVWVGNKSTTYVYNTTLTNTFTSVTGGTLELANNITLDNGLSLNLSNGGTIRSSGSTTTNGRINLSNAAGNNATISTVNAADVFTIGNGANDFTGGAADTVVHIAGPGTVVNSQASTNYLGTISIDAGALRNGSGTNGLGVNGIVTFGNGSTGKLQLGNNLGLTSLTTNGATPTAGVVETGVAGTQTLTLTTAVASPNTYGGTLRNGTGTLALVKAGPGMLTLSGNTNTYSGGTQVNNGALNVTNVSGSATGTGALTLGAATLTGAGFITGPTTTAATSFILPGTVTAGSAGAGVLTLGDLTLTAGTTINYGLDAGNPTANYIKAATLTLPGAGTIVVNLFTPGTASPFAAAGTYDLFQYTTLAGGPVSGAFSIGTSITGYTPSFTTSGGFVQLMLTAAGVVANWINGNGTANWSEAGNWSGGVPSSPGDVATFSSGTTPGTVNLDVNKTVGGVTFNHPASYTISGANTLTLDNSGAGAAIGVSAGTHTIQTAMALNDNLTVTPVTGAQLTISGNISQITGTRSLTVGGAGTLVLSGVNSYSGGTFVGNGILNFNGLSALGSGTTLDLGNATTNGTLRYASGNTADVSSLTVTLNAGGGTIDTNGNDVTLANSIGNNGAGGLIKAGSGTLTLAGANSYTGATTIGAGKISVSSNASLGSQATAAPLIFTGTGGKVATTASFGLFNGAAGTNDRAIAINGANGTLAPASGTTLTVSGPITGTGKLIKEDGGQVTIQNATAFQNTYSGGTLVSAGTIALADANANAQGLGTGTVTFEGGTVKLFSNPVLATDAGNFANNLVVNTGQTGTLIAMARGTIGGSLTGNGTLNYQTDYVRAQLNGNWSAFTGQINVTPNTNGGDFRLITTAGFGTARINLANGVTMYMQTNFGAGGLSNSIGELTGGALSFLRGGPTGGRVMTWSVGGANTNAQFDGAIQDGTGTTAITKAGAGSWTLTHANTYTGVTAVSAGILNIQNSAALGDVAGATTVSNGATLQLQGNISVGAEALTLNGGAAAGQSGALVNVSGTNTYGGAITVAASSSISALTGSTLNLTGGVVKNGTTATLTGGGTINVTGTGISGSIANSDLVVDGVTLNEGVANTYNGPTSIINAGVLNANVAGALPSATRTALSMDQTGSGGSTVALGASQSAASLTGAASSIVNLGANTLTIGAASGTNTFAGVISGTGGTLIKDDNSTQILSGPNTYDGGTTLSGGTLTVGHDSALGSGAVIFNGGKLASDNDSRSLSYALVVNNVAGNEITGSGVTLTGNVSGAGALQVNLTDNTKIATLSTATNAFAPGTLDVKSGTLLLSGSEKIGNSTAVILNGGTFNTGGFSEGDVNTDGLGFLTLSANSTLDFGAGTGSQLWFSGFASHTAATTLAIIGWSGTDAQAGGATDDRLIFAGTASSFTNVFNPSEVSFNGNFGYTAIQFDLGHYEIVPVPEPSSIATVMGLLGVVGWRERRKARQARSAERRVCVS